MSNLYEFKKDDRNIAHLTLNRPEVHNAFNDELISELTNKFNELNMDDSIRLIVLSGKGKSFCAGADLNWMKSMVNYSEEENFIDSINLANLFETINNCKKPIIGKINGHALGGGCGLVSVCDFAITTNRAKFAFSEVKLGILPATISPFVISKIGESHARALFMSGHTFKGEHAKLIGLVHDVCDLEELDDRVNQAINNFLLAGPKAAQAAKSLISNVQKLQTKCLEDSEHLKNFTCREIAKARISKEGQDGMNALLEKRKANWLQKS